MLALNSFPNVTCGLAAEPTDAYLFSQINGGNALSIPYAKGFGWGAELNLKLIFERLFAETAGGGYPKERAVPEQRNARILNEVKQITHNDMMTILKQIDQDFLKETIASLQTAKMKKLLLILNHFYNIAITCILAIPLSFISSLLINIIIADYTL